MPKDSDQPRPEEQQAVRTTIVGGRPPGCGKSVGNIPRGIEVLVKKAAVDPEFKALLLAKRGEAARTIGLTLSPAESMMLSAVPAAQLESIIAATTVPASHVLAFLGKVAAVMLAALGIIQCGCDDSRNAKPAGIRPEDMPKDNIPATTQAAAPADDQPITIAGAVYVRPMTRPTTQPAERIGPVAGIRPTTSPGIAGERIDRPPDAPDFRPEAVETFGLRVDRPENSRVAGLRVDVKPETGSALPPKPTEDQSQPAPDRPQPNVTMLGIMIDRPQAIRGIRADVPRPAPATQPAGEPATEPSPPVAVFGAMIDRPQVIKGIRVDRPEAPTTLPTTNPTTKPSAQSPQVQPPTTIAGISPTPPPEPLSRGIRPDRPPAQKPTTQPAAKSEPAEPDFPMVVEGIRPDRPRAPKPTTQPSANSEPPKPDFPIAVDGIRPDRPRRSEEESK